MRAAISWIQKRWRALLAIAVSAWLAVTFIRWTLYDVFELDPRDWGSETLKLSDQRLLFMWVFFGLLISGLLALAGYLTNGRLLGAIIDSRNRMSLSQLQIASWMVLSMSAFIAIALPRALPGSLQEPSEEQCAAREAELEDGGELVCESDPLGISLPAELLVVLGISVGSVATAGFIKAGKGRVDLAENNSPSRQIEVLRREVAEIEASLPFDRKRVTAANNNVQTETGGVRTAEAAVATARSHPTLVALTDKLSEVETAQKAVEAAKTRVSDASEADKPRAEQELEEAEAASAALSSQLDDAQKAATQAQAAVKDAEEALAAQQARLSAARTSTEEAVQTVAEAESNLSQKQRSMAELEAALKTRLGTLYRNEDETKARLGDIFRGDEIADFNRVDIAKVQMLIITVALLISYGLALYSLMANESSLLDPLGVNFPGFSESMVVLLGISHAGYLTMKATDKTGQVPEEA